MLLPVSGVGMNSMMDDMNLIQHAQRHHLMVRELAGEERDLEIAQRHHLLHYCFIHCRF